MDRWDGALVALCLLGLALFLSGPAEPTSSLSVSESPDATPTEVVDFVDLETDAQREFLAVLDGEKWHSPDPPALHNGFVHYKRSLYRVFVSASESSVASLLQPVLGGGTALLGLLGIGLRRLRRRYRD